MPLTLGAKYPASNMTHTWGHSAKSTPIVRINLHLCSMFQATALSLRFFFFLVDIYKWDRYNSTLRFQEKVKKKHKTAILPPPIFTLLSGQIPRFHGKCDFLLHFQTLCREDHKGKCEGHKTEAFCLTLDHSFGVQTVL